MIKSWIAFWTVAIALLGGLLFWRNRKRYRRRSAVYLIGKSLLELVLLLTTAVTLPGMLIAWCVMWATKPVKRPWMKAVVGVFTGILFGFLSSFALEALVFCGIFAIDLKTGEHDSSGFLNCWRRAKLEEKAAMRAA